MNIFVLDYDPAIAAQYHCDVHVNKMILESAQMLSTAHWHRGGQGPYKATHAGHPCNIWCRKSSTNYLWLFDLFANLLKQYEFMKGKHHKCAELLTTLNALPPTILDGPLTPFAVAMPDEMKMYTTVNNIDVVASYRNYYNHKHLMFKRNVLQWTGENRSIPSWYNPSI